MKSITGSIPCNLEFNKNIQVYQENNMDVVIELPEPDKERDRECIEDIKKIMIDELLSQINESSTLSMSNGYSQSALPAKQASATCS